MIKYRVCKLALFHNQRKMLQRLLSGFTALVLLVVFTSSVHSQTFENTFQKFSNNFIPERIHLHLDKSSYATGDTIWFKAYLINGITPVEDSKTLYIDWTDPSGKLISRSTLPIISGVAFGQTEIPPAFAGNAIHLKAYTKWMLNFDSAFLYNRDIPIINTNEIAGTKQITTYQFSLFPEGGDLLYGATSKVAFKATDGYGNPVHVNVNLMEGNKAIQKVNDMHDGMGFFYIRPIRGNQYSVSWKDPSGKEHTTSLPEIKSSGVSMQLLITPDKRTLLIQGVGSNAKGTFHIIGTMYNQPVFNIERSMQDSSVTAIIPVNTLPSGILRITVLDSLYHPLSERITFINNNEFKFRTDMQVAHWGMNKRARNELEISVPDSLGANLSISVTDARLDLDTTQNIMTDLLLTDEIKGKVYNPAFYLGNNEDSTQKLLDLVMLTNGWRKINWTDLAAGILPKIQFNKDTSYMTISGRLYGATPGQLQNAGDVILIVNQKGKSDWIMAPVNPDGRFDATNFILFDTATVYYQPPKGKGLGNVSVQFSEKRLPTLSLTNATSPFVRDTSGRSLQFQLSRQLMDELKFNQTKVLETVTIKARTKSPTQIMDEKYTSGLFSGGDSRGFDLVNDPSAVAFTSIFDYLRGRVAGIQISTDNPPVLSWRGGSPALFLNEMPVTSDVISTIPVSDIAYVKVLNPPFMGATGGGGSGAIAIYTRRGDDQQSTPGKGLSRNTVTGYSVERKFYSPNYDLTDPEQKDLRTTLYWNPTVRITPGQKTATVTFFNNDISESFRIVIEGMSPDGKFTRTVKVME